MEWNGAVGHAILIMVGEMLKRKTAYTELGGSYFDEHARQSVMHRTAKRLESPVYIVSRKPKPKAA